jgi:hypothetical protein
MWCKKILGVKMKECKYKLPCNWCDKFNKYCDMTEPIKIELPDPNKCDHDWKLEGSYVDSEPEECKHNWVLYKKVIHTAGEDYHKRCSKCGAMRVESGDVTYESGEWQP